jgi:hypothetical protein
VKNFILEVKNIKPCPGGHSCSLTANGKKVAYVAPDDIFEWTNHNAMVDVLEFYGASLGLDNTGPVELEDGWMEKNAPSRKKLEMQSHAQDKLSAWVRSYVAKHLKAKQVLDLCKQTVLIGMPMGRGSMQVVDFCQSPSTLKNPLRRKFIEDVLVAGQIILNDMTLDQLITIL